jgi:molybdopterin-binding protein
VAPSVAAAAFATDAFGVYLREKGAQMKISARNVLKGKVSKVVHGAVSSEVAIELPNGIQVIAVITKSSAKKLGLKKGNEAYAVIKASSVMVAVD